MAEFGPDLCSQLELNTSYMDYLEDAKYSIDQCRLEAIVFIPISFRRKERQLIA